ncbi:DUF58 domain-containing protein [Polaribacter litorisediminis]|uniref:DUF58 domain-containing protein n=1 Tax=Polaribacter litorisediminis TaxID=1908341 RepID=UPI001CBAE852|nr:DUF58 domain-containing protein [Polaribacter litorisediminis]UAM97134.1 DUF58 domain-containing protein [Polaribacter litorisediminis]
MKQDYHQLLKPEIINTVSGLTLISKIIAEGYLTGLNHSARVGYGMEFSQYRAYENGDDLRLLDWKMLARSGRYYIKQSEIETNVSIKFILDASLSMLHKEDGLTKIDFAKVLIASLSYLAQKQGDAVGLFALNEKSFISLQPKIQKQHFNRLLAELIEINNEGKWPNDTLNSDKLHDRAHKELVFFITDLYEHDKELTNFIKQLKTTKNEVVVLHLLGKNEANFNYKGSVTFEDLETGNKLKVDTKEVKRTYLKNAELMMNQTKDFLLKNKINYHLFQLDEPIHKAIKFFIDKRTKMN